MRKKRLYPIQLWALHERRWHLFNFYESISEALESAKNLPSTPLVLSTNCDLPFLEDCLAAVEFSEARRW
ncbi:MAG: hypothetical protein AB1898_17280 [Acidobacteriota bacterium]